MVKPVGNKPQVHPLTTALRNICRDYPAGGTVLRELLQNADDAGATTVNFVLDETTYETGEGKLIDDELQKFQGPALLAYNNAKFTTEDFNSLARIGDSSKFQDGTTTGKFGRGFNSVFNWTDSPSIVSHDRLLILDPHNDWSTGGPMYDFVSDAEDDQVNAQMQAYGMVLKCLDRPLDGTLIRIPLRSEEQISQRKVSKHPSAISEHPTTFLEIADVLIAFFEEFKGTGLLFMRNIQTLSMTVGNGKPMIVELADQEKQRQNKTCIKEAIKKASNDKDLDFDLSFCVDIVSTSDAGRVEKNFAVHHRIGSRTMSPVLKEWSTDQQMIPWVAVATEIEIYDLPYQGSLFTVLPLPINIDQPVFIHSLFSLSPDRAKLHKVDDKSLQDKLPGQWNAWIFEEPIPAAWTELLLYVSKMNPIQETFSRWPHMSNDPLDIFNTTRAKFLQIVREKKLPLWFTTIGYKSFTDSLLDSGHESQELKDALKEANVPVVYVPDEFRFAASYAFASRTLCPQTLCKFLLENKIRTRHWSAKTQQVILEYVLVDPAAPYTLLEIFPYEDGIRRSLVQQLTFVHRNDLERQLFDLAKESNLDLSQFSPKGKNLVLHACTTPKKNTGFRHRSLIEFVDYLKNTVFKKIDEGKDSASLEESTIAYVSKSWTWLGFYDNIPITYISSLWLIPLTNGLFRKVCPCELSSATIYAAEGETGDILKKLSAMPVRENRPLLLTGTKFMSDKVLLSILKAARKGESLCIGSGDNVEDFVWWLGNIGNIVKQLPAEDKNSILRIISGYLQSKRAVTSQAFTRAIHKLEIFQEISWELNGQTSDPTWKWTTASANSMSIGLLDGMVPVPAIQGHQFLNAESFHVQTILKTMPSTTLVKESSVVQNYILPQLEREGSLLTTTGKNIPRILLKHYPTLSVPIQARIKTLEFIPTVRISGGSSTILAKGSDLIDPEVSALQVLYFDNEAVLPSDWVWKEFSSTLRQCGMKTAVDLNVVCHRIRSYAAYAESNRLVEQVEKRARSLLETPVDLNAAMAPSLQDLKWLPVTARDGTKSLADPKHSRGEKQKLLVDFEFPILHVKLSTDWKRFLGWDSELPQSILLSQLSKGIKNNRREVVDAVMFAIFRHSKWKTFLSDLEIMTCVIDTNKKYILPSTAFLFDCEKLQPYVGQVETEFWIKHTELLRCLKVQYNPKLKDLLLIQEILGNRQPLSEADQKVAVETVLQASSFPDVRSKGLKILTKNCELLPLEEVNYGDLGMLRLAEDVNLVHPGISNELAAKLGIEPLRERLLRGMLELDDNDDEDEFIQQQKDSTRISNLLERYPIETTFKEYLANADDTKCVTKINWLLDKRQHSKELLITKELADLQGHALLTYNDGIFSDDDFEGLKNVGEGSKRFNKTTIGQFGIGSQTMYHWTDVPMILSGKYLLILDPLENVLPMNYSKGKRKPGLKLLLKNVRNACPGQLAPFDQLWGYNMQMDEYPGTIFRFALRKPGKTSLLRHSPPLDARDTHKNLITYFDEARISMLFLKRVSSMSFQVHGEEQPEWSVSRDPALDEEEERVFSESITCSFTRKIGEEFLTGVDKWWVAIEDLESAAVKLKYLPLRKQKNSECGIAALISTNLNNPSNIDFKEANQSRLFSSLPLVSDGRTHVPIHIHATFALHGDRQNLHFTNQVTEVYGTNWNRLLLTEALPELYLEFLDDLGRQIPDRILDFWPQKDAPAESYSELFIASFWKKLAKSRQRLFPGIQRPGRQAPKLFDIRDAVFNFLPKKESDMLANILQPLIPELIRSVPGVLTKKLLAINPAVNCIDGKRLRTLFKTNLATDTLLKNFQKNPAVIDIVLGIILPKGAGLDDLAELNLCRILPLANKSLGLLQMRGSGRQAQQYFVASDDELKLFDFASDVLVSMVRGKQFRLVVEDDRFNIKELQIEHVAKLLEKVAIPLSSTTPHFTQWLERFWKYWDAKSATGPGCALPERPIFLAHCGKTSKYRCPSEFAALPAIVVPDRKTHSDLCNKIPGLHQFNSKHLPKHLVAEQANLDHRKSFVRFIHAINTLAKAKGQDVGDFVVENFSSDDLKLTRELVIKHVYTEEDVIRSQSDGSIEIMKSLPLWLGGTEKSSDSRFISARSASLAQDNGLLIRWIPQYHQFIQSTKLNTAYAPGCLQKLGVKVISAETLLLRHVLPNLPATLADSDKSQYLQLIATVDRIWQTNGATIIKSTLRQSRIAVDQAFTMCQPSKLYDHLNPIFLAAFRDQPTKKFLHLTFQKHHDFWLTMGLRHQVDGFLNGSDYVLCLEALAVRQQACDNLNSNELLGEDARIVLKPLLWPTSSLREFTTSHWTSISNQRVFVASRSRSLLSYRQPSIDKHATSKPLLALREIISTQHDDVCWSQISMPINQPTAEVLSKMPHGGNPPVDMVWRHAKYLQSISSTLSSDDVASFVSELFSTYSYLQEHLQKSKDSFSMRDLPIWLNVNTTEPKNISLFDLRDSWISVPKLIMSGSNDFDDFRFARASLLRFDKLLRALGCPTFVWPDASAVQQHSPHSIILNLQRLKLERTMLDVTFIVANEEFRAHRIVLAAASSYCAAQFSDRWSNNEKIELDDEIFSPKTLSAVIKFAYEEPIDWAAVKVSEIDSDDAKDEKLQDLLDLHGAANYLGMPALMSDIRERIIQSTRLFVRSNNVRWVEEQAESVGADFLVEFCKDTYLLNPFL